MDNKKNIVVKHIITGNVYSVNNFNKEKHIPYIPKPIKLLPNDLTLTCTQCGSTQTYCNKYSYRRAVGKGPDNTQKNKGWCGKCSRSNKRKPHGPRSKEWTEQNRLLRVREAGFNSIEEYEDNVVVMGKKHRYYDNVDAISRTNLKREKPELYKLWNENTWDGKDMNKLTIEHKKPKSVCWKDRVSITEASHIDNLEVITMKENNKRWRDYQLDYEQ
jgi:hypothetical protein